MTLVAASTQNLDSVHQQPITVCSTLWSSHLRQSACMQQLLSAGFSHIELLLCLAHVLLSRASHVMRSTGGWAMTASMDVWQVLA